MAGQKNRKNMNAPTAVNFASGKRVITAEDICGQWLDGECLVLTRTYNIADLLKRQWYMCSRAADVIDENCGHDTQLHSIPLELFGGRRLNWIEFEVEIVFSRNKSLEDLLKSCFQV